MDKHDLEVIWLVQTLKGLQAEVSDYEALIEKNHNPELRREAIAKAEALQRLVADMRPLIPRRIET